MRVIIQRVLKADCIVNKEIVSSIHHGMMILVGFTHTDSEKEIEQMALKIAKLRIFEDSNGKMNLSIQDVGVVFYLFHNLHCMLIPKRGIDHLLYKL